MNLAGAKIKEFPEGKSARILSPVFQKLLFGVLNSWLNVKIQIPVTDGLQIVGYKTADVKISDQNAVITLPVMSAGTGTEGASISQFKIVSDGGDYWNCKTWDGTTLGTDITKVAKPYKLRAGTGKIASEAIRGITYTYTYTAVTVSGVTGYYTRAVSGSDGSAETDYMIPDPLANDIIYAASFATTTPSTLSDVEWIDLNVDGRAWAK